MHCSATTLVLILLSLGACSDSSSEEQLGATGEVVFTETSITATLQGMPEAPTEHLASLFRDYLTPEQKAHLDGIDWLHVTAGQLLEDPIVIESIGSVGGDSQPLFAPIAIPA